MNTENRWNPEALKALGRLDLIAHEVLDGIRQGLHRSIRRGFSAEFFDYRSYEPSDDAAKIDGCSEGRTLISVALPLVYPTIATLGLFYAVGRWNGISDVLYYINSSELFTVQMVLKQFIESINVTAEEGIQTNLVADNIKAASIVISMLPMLIVYPFVQKFFTKGIMIGAVKG